MAYHYKKTLIPRELNQYVWICSGSDPAVIEAVVVELWFQASNSLLFSSQALSAGLQQGEMLISISSSSTSIIFSPGPTLHLYFLKYFKSSIGDHAAGENEVMPALARGVGAHWQ